MTYFIELPELVIDAYLKIGWNIGGGKRQTGIEWISLVQLLMYEQKEWSKNLLKKW